MQDALPLGVQLPPPCRHALQFGHQRGYGVGIVGEADRLRQVGPLPVDLLQEPVDGRQDLHVSLHP
ncbi:MAG: hypothetical protein QJR03_11920 [Sphaerobacter sp.]|nr:hypothetical protein [Sphaerobacter sp.]